MDETNEIKKAIDEAAEIGEVFIERAGMSRKGKIALIATGVIIAVVGGTVIYVVNKRKSKNSDNDGEGAKKTKANYRRWFGNDKAEEILDTDEVDVIFANAEEINE